MFSLLRRPDQVLPRDHTDLAFDHGLPAGKIRQLASACHGRHRKQNEERQRLSSLSHGPILAHPWKFHVGIAWGLWRFPLRFVAHFREISKNVILFRIGVVSPISGFLPGGNMPLIICPDCKNSVSDAAPNCPHCGRPTNVQPPIQMQAPAVQAIKRPSKQFKTHQIYSCLTVLAGLALLVVSAFSIGGKRSTGFGLLMLLSLVVIVCGIIWAMAAKAQSWWHHK